MQHLHVPLSSFKGNSRGRYLDDLLLRLRAEAEEPLAPASTQRPAQRAVQFSTFSERKVDEADFSCLLLVAQRVLLQYFHSNSHIHFTSSSA